MSRFSFVVGIALFAVGACSDSGACPNAGAVKTNGICTCPPGTRIDEPEDGTSVRCVAKGDGSVSLAADGGPALAGESPGSDAGSGANPGDAAVTDARAVGADSGAPADASEPVAAACAPNPCGANELCAAASNADGYTCQCATGFTMSGAGCVDSDECTLGTNTCHLSANCENSVGSYECTCLLGFSGGGRTGLACTPRLAAGAGHYCMATSDDRVTCWGNNESGQLGDGTTTSRTTAAYVDGLTNVAAVDTGENFSCALLRDGTVQCWGSNDTLQLGVDGTENRLRPVVVQGLAGAVQIALPKSILGMHYACALLSDQSVVCWGSNSAGALGNGSVGGSAVSYPVAVRSIINARSLSCAGANCVTGMDGRLRCWGGSAVLAYGGTPQEPFSTTDAVDLSVGPVIACATDLSEDAFCWGGTGLVGGSNSASSSSFLQPQAPARSLSVGLYHVCAVLESGDLNCWGLKTTPVVVSSSTLVASSFSSTVCALLSNGAPRCWDVQSSTPKELAVPDVRAW